MFILKVIGLPFAFVGKTASFLVWNIFQPVKPKLPSCGYGGMIRVLEDDLIAANRRIREQANQHRLELYQLEKRYQDRLARQMRDFQLRNH